MNVRKMRVGGEDSLGNTYCAIYCSAKHCVRFLAKSCSAPLYLLFLFLRDFLTMFIKMKLKKKRTKNKSLSFYIYTCIHITQYDK